MKTPHEIVALVDIGFAMPLVLIMNFSLFQYLITTFWRRRHESRVRLLIVVAFLSFAALVPFAFPDRELGRNLNDISEVCTVLTFLMQITILTRDVGKRIKIRSVRMLMWCGEMLVIAGLVMLVANFVDIVAPEIDMDLVELIDNIVEHVSLAFIVGFRFYFLAMAKGYRKVFETQKREMAFYLLFLFHEIPFHIATHYTELDFNHMQAFWMRMTIVLCLSMTIKARLSSMGSKKGLTTTKNGPVASTFDQKRSVTSEAVVVPMKKSVSVSLRPAAAVSPALLKR